MGFRWFRSWEDLLGLVLYWFKELRKMEYPIRSVVSSALFPKRTEQNRQSKFLPFVKPSIISRDENILLDRFRVFI